MRGAPVHFLPWPLLGWGIAVAAHAFFLLAFLCQRSLAIRSNADLARERGGYRRSSPLARIMACARLCTPSLPQRL